MIDRLKKLFNSQSLPPDTATKLQQMLIELGRDTFNFEVRKRQMMEQIVVVAAQNEAEKRIAATAPAEPNKETIK